MPLLKRWLSLTLLFAVSTIYLWPLATTPFTHTQALKADRLQAKKPYRIHHKSYYTIWYFCEWAPKLPDKNVPRGTRLRGRAKKTQPLIFKGCAVVVTVGLEPTTPSMWTAPFPFSGFGLYRRTPYKSSLPEIFRFLHFPLILPLFLKTLDIC